MSKIVYSLREAEEWFLENHSGSVICQFEDKEKECSSFKEAKDFFNSNNK